MSATKFDGDGNIQWAASSWIDRGSVNIPCAIHVDPMGNVYLIGTAVTGGQSFYTVIKYLQTPTSVDVGRSSAPEAFALDQNYPNPFNPATQISYQLPIAARISLKVFDLLGREVAVLVNEEKPAGSYVVSWDASSMPSGIYFCRLETMGVDGKGWSATKKTMLTK